MNKRIRKKFLSTLFAVLILVSMCGQAFAIEDVLGEDDISRRINIQETQMLSQGNVLMIQDDATEENIWSPTSDYNTIADSIQDSTMMATYIVQISSDKYVAMNLISENMYMIAQVYELDEDTGMIGNLQFTEYAYDGVLTTGGLNAGLYVVIVWCVDETSEEISYSLSWNSYVPLSSASDVLYYSSNLAEVYYKVIPSGASNYTIYCNGSDFIDDLEWTETWMLTTSSGYRARDQIVHDIYPARAYAGTYSSNRGSTNNALFIETGPQTLWMIMQSVFISNPTQHVMDYTDATGQTTPRRLTEDDMRNGPHYVVVDMDTGTAIDFISPYNYLWLTGQNSNLSVSFTSLIFVNSDYSNLYNT